MPRRKCSLKKVLPRATLDDIARTAGYTKGVIYKHFAAKEAFLGIERPVLASLLQEFRRRPINNERGGDARNTGIDAKRWREFSNDGGAEHAALGHEFTLYLLRNPAARNRAAAKRSR